MSAKEHTAGYLDRMSGGWSDRYKGNRHFQARLRTVLAWMASLRSRLEILDYGCGSGVLLRALAEIGHRMTGADISDGMLAEARSGLDGLPSDQVASVRLVPVDAAFSGAYGD